MNKTIKILHKEYKSSLNKLKFPDSWFWARYTINPYSGCEHACIYCDARSQRYYLEQDFENEIIVKTNISQNLELKLKRARTLIPDVVGPGGVSDAYQPIEETVRNTQKILEIFAKYHFPVNIATKSNLIVRDVNLLDAIAINTWCTVGFSITTTDEDLSNFLEPYSSTPSERLTALKTIKKESTNVQVGTYLMPIIPFLEDNDQNLENVIRESKKAGADFLLFSPGLTLRDSQAEFFIMKLKNSKYKDIVKSLLNLFKGKIYPPGDYAKKLNTKLLEYCQKYKLPIRIKRWIPNDYRKWNYKISEILLNKEYLEVITTGKSDNNMKWAGLYLNNLKESILDVYKRGELKKIKNFNYNIVALVEPLLVKALEIEPKRGLDRFV